MNRDTVDPHVHEVRPNSSRRAADTSTATLRTPSAPTAPRRHDHTLEPTPLAGCVIDTAVIHPRCLDLDPACRRPCPSRSSARPVTSSSSSASSAAANIRRAPGQFMNDLIEAQTQLSAWLVLSQYSQHRHSFLASASTPTSLVWFNEEGTPPLERMTDPQVLAITRPSWALALRKPT